MENLWRAATVAVRYMAGLRRLGGLTAESKQELLTDWTVRSVTHFLEFKIRRHTYCRQTKDGKDLDFFDNVLSSCWSSFRGAFEWHRNHWIEPAVNTEDIDRAVPGTDLRFSDLIGDDYTNKLRYSQKNWHTNPGPRKLIRHTPGQRINLYKNTYEIVCEDREMMGLEPVTFEEFLKLCTEDGDIIDEAIQNPAVMTRVEPGGFWEVDINGKRHLTERGREWNRKYMQAKREANRKIREERAKAWANPNYMPPPTARKRK